MTWSYSKSGVDQKKIKLTHSEIAKLIQNTYNFRAGKFAEVLEGFGHYASLIDIGEGRALALHTDGCGTKVLIAQLMNKYNTIGIDCVAMCTNDLVCLGAEPTTLIDYLALEKPDENLVREIMTGLVEAAKKTKISIIGGETAIMPDVIKGAVPGKGFDLAAFCLGEAKKERIIKGSKLEPEDVIIGIESSGIHSNGLTLARKVLLKKNFRELKRKPPELDRTIGEELLEPTRIYVEPIINAIENTEIHAIAHITGGAFTKLRRFESYAKVGFQLDNMPKPQPIFNLIQKTGKITDEEMYRTFNMGIGLCIITPKKNIEEIISIFKDSSFAGQIIGKVVSSCGVILDLKGKILKL